MVQRIRLAWGVAARSFGVRFAPAITLLAFCALHSLNTLGLALDRLLFRLPPVSRPILIVGNPRTGTTFLHRFLSDHGVGHGQPLWRMLFPARVWQPVVRPLLPLLEAVSPARHHATVAHEVSLTSVETDDVSLLFRYFDGFFLFGFFLAWDEVDHAPQFDPTVRNVDERDLAWFEALWSRGQHADGAARVVAKPFGAQARAPAFLRQFPDARILYMVRDPVEVIPSALSLVSGVLDKRFGFWRLPEADRRRWSERVYRGLVSLMRRFYEDWTAGDIPRDRVLIVRYDRMMSDFEGTMSDIAAFVEHPVDASLAAAIRATAERQRGWSSAHRYDLARFGLDADQIRRDCAFYYQEFLS
jgi:hypothetical protein